MVETLAHFFLSFSHQTIIVPLILIGYFWLDRKIFYHALILLFISMLVNVALKATYKIPLSPALGQEGYAFPSGHMQSSIVFYGWLMIQFRNYKLFGLIIGLLTGIGFSLIYFHYHNLHDVLGALLFGSFVLGAYRIFYAQKNNALRWIVLLLSTLLLIYIGKYTQN